MKTIITLLTFATFASCATTPAPTPTPTPTDALAGLVFDCEASWIASEHDVATNKVEDCADLVADQVAPCLAELATSGTLHPDTIGCEARDVGNRTSAAVAAGTASESDRQKAVNLRLWTRSEKVSYR